MTSTRITVRDIIVELVQRGDIHYYRTTVTRPWQWFEAILSQSLLYIVQNDRRQPLLLRQHFKKITEKLGTDPRPYLTNPDTRALFITLIAAAMGKPGAAGEYQIFFTIYPNCIYSDLQAFGNHIKNILQERSATGIMAMEK